MIRRLSRRRLTLLYIISAYLIFFVCPVALYVLVGMHSTLTLLSIHYAVATAYLFTSFMIISETRASWKRKHAPVGHETVRPRLPMVTAIVSAYLPNEQGIIAETILQLSTQMHIPTHKLQIILAYNSPDDLAVEEILSGFSRMNASFLALRVPDSKSKAENIMAALPYATGEMTVVLDADHHPLPDAFERAYRWLERGYDIVQGRCVIRKQNQSWLARYIAIEFEQIYAVSHAGRSLRFDVALFGGSNGYWRTSVLREIGMDHHMLTEDIDATMRATLAGYKIIHDRSVVSSELAPPSVQAWWRQRLRWAQGWLQVTLKHQRAVFKSDHLTLRQKAYWTYLLSWREVYAILSLQVFALLLAAVLLHFKISWFSDRYLLATSVVTLTSGPLAAWAAYRVALWRTQSRLRWWFLIYGATAIVFTTVKNTVALVAMVRHMLGKEHEWVVTPRTRAGESIPLQETSPVSVDSIVRRAAQELHSELVDIGIDDDVLTLPQLEPLEVQDRARSSAADRGLPALRNVIDIEFGSQRARYLLFEPALRAPSGSAKARLELSIALKGIWSVRRPRDMCTLAFGDEEIDYLGVIGAQGQGVGPTTFDMELLAWILGRWEQGSQPIEFTLRQCARDFGTAWSGRWAGSLHRSLEVLAAIRVEGAVCRPGGISTLAAGEPLLTVAHHSGPGAPQVQRIAIVLSDFLIGQLQSGVSVDIDWHVLRRRLQTPLERRLYVFILAEQRRRVGCTALEIDLAEPFFRSLGTVDRGNLRRLRASIGEAALGIQQAEPRVESVELIQSGGIHALRIDLKAGVPV